MEYESVKEKLSGVTKDKRCKYNKFKDEDHYMIAKCPAIHGTAAALKNSKNISTLQTHWKHSQGYAWKIPSNYQVPIMPHRKIQRL